MRASTNAYEARHNQKFHREHDELHETLADVLHEDCDPADADRFRAGLLEVAYRAHNIASIRLQKYVRWAYASSNNRGRMLELRAFQNLIMGLIQLAAHEVSLADHIGTAAHLERTVPPSIETLLT